MEHRALEGLRAAATFTHSLPGLGALVMSGDEPVLRVDPAPCDVQVPAGDPEGGPLVVTPHQFRCAVAHVWRHHQAGEPARLAGLDDPAPTVVLQPPTGGEARPGGLHRLPCEDRWVWAFALTLDVDAAYLAGADLVRDALPIPGLRAMGIRPDPSTDVALAFAETDARPGSDADGEVVDLLEGLMARWATAELLAGLGTPAASAGGDDVRTAPG